MATLNEVPEAIPDCYAAAREVYFFGRNRELLVEAIADQYEVKASSISMTVQFFVNALKGKPHKRGTRIGLVKYALRMAETAPELDAVNNTLASLDGHLRWSDEQDGNRRPGIRKVVEEFRRNRQDRHVPQQTALAFQKHENERRAAAEKLSDADLARRALAAEAGGRPTARVSTERVHRNPYVREYVLRQAAGICQGCRKPAPFRHRDTSRPFLEVHHRIPLAEGGDDTVENAVALCPNCHREAHHGENWEKFRP